MSRLLLGCCQQWFVARMLQCESFVARMLLSSEQMQQFNRARVFLDEDFTAVEKFTVS